MCHNDVDADILLLLLLLMLDGIDAAAMELTRALFAIRGIKSQCLSAQLRHLVTAPGEEIECVCLGQEEIHIIITSTR